jgi:hypothetical protein
MGTYTPQETLIPTGLDEIGLRLGLERLPEESLSTYRKRLLLEARDPGSTDSASFIRGINRKVALFDKHVLNIELINDADGYPLAADPYVEVTATHLRCYSDYDNEVLDIEISLLDSKWLTDLATEFSSSSYFSLSEESEYEDYLKSDRLRIGNSNILKDSFPLYESYENSFGVGNIKTVWFSNSNVFLNEKASRGDVTESGDFWIDKDEGVVISNDTQLGYATFIRRDFPFKLYWQPVKVELVNDEDLNYRIKDKAVSDETGELEPMVLNSNGKKIYNAILEAHPLEWGR